MAQFFGDQLLLSRGERAWCRPVGVGAFDRGHCRRASVQHLDNRLSRSAVEVGSQSVQSRGRGSNNSVDQDTTTAVNEARCRVWAASAVAHPSAVDRGRCNSAPIASAADTNAPRA